MMQGIGRMKDVFHPAVGLITRGNVARCCFSESKWYFWQGWGSWAGDGLQGSWGWASQPHQWRHTVLLGSWQGLPRVVASSLLPQGSCGWHGGSRKKGLRSLAWGFSDSDQQYAREITAVASALPLAASGAVFHGDTLMPLKNILLFLSNVSIHIHSTLGNSLLSRPLLSGWGTAAHHHTQKPYRKRSFSHF